MWTIFKVFLEFVTILLLFYTSVFWLQGMWDLRSPTRDRTCTLCTGRWSPKHWAIREVPSNNCLKKKTKTGFSIPLDQCPDSAGKRSRESESRCRCNMTESSPGHHWVLDGVLAIAIIFKYLFYARNCVRLFNQGFLCLVVLLSECLCPPNSYVEILIPSR